MIITLNKNFLWSKTILFCVHCDTNTVHALSKTGDYYSCGCGEIIKVELEDDDDN